MIQVVASIYTLSTPNSYNVLLDGTKQQGVDCLLAFQSRDMRLRHVIPWRYQAGIGSHVTSNRYPPLRSRDLICRTRDLI